MSGVWNIGVDNLLAKLFLGLNLLILLFICAVAFMHASSIFVMPSEKETVIMEISDVGLFLLPVVTHFTILSEVYIKREKIAKVLEILRKLKRNGSNDSKISQIIWKSELACLCVATFVEANIISFATLYTPKWARHWFVTEFSFIGCHIGTLYYIYYVVLMRNLLNDLSDELTYIKRYSIWNWKEILNSSFQRKFMKVYLSLLKCH